MSYFVINSQYVKFISLSILGMLGAVGTIIADTFFVSNQLGALGLAALNIALPIFGIINGIGLMIGIGGASYYSIYKVQQKDKKANMIYTTAFVLALIFGLVLFVVGLFFSRNVSIILGANLQTLSWCQTYLKVILCFAPGFILNHFWIAFIRNDGNAHYPMLSMLVGNFMNILLDYIFMYPMKMGIFGSALATGIAPLIGVSISLLYMLQKKHHFHFSMIQWNFAKKILAIGANSFVNEFAASFVILIFNALILKEAGNIGVAAYGVIANYALVMTAIYTGISQGVQPLMSQAYGKKDAIYLTQLYRTTILLGIMIGLFIYFLIFLFPSPFVAFFNTAHNMSLQRMAIQGMKLYFIGFIISIIPIITSVLFSTTEQPHLASFLSTFRGLIGMIIIAVLFAKFFGIIGIWLAFPTVELLSVCVSIILKVLSRTTLK